MEGARKALETGDRVMKSDTIRSNSSLLPLTWLSGVANFQGPSPGPSKSIWPEASAASPQSIAVETQNLD